MPDTKPWPPPPDLESIQQLVREADIEGHLAEGAPEDEYEPEETAILNAIHNFSTAQLTASNIQPILEAVWHKSFSLNEEELGSRKPKLHSLAEQIEHFFGPEAKPQVRGQ